MNQIMQEREDFKRNLTPLFKQKQAICEEMDLALNRLATGRIIKKIFNDDDSDL